MLQAESVDRESAIRGAFSEGNLELAASETFEIYGDEILGFLIVRLRNVSDAQEAFSMFAEDLWKGMPVFELRCSARGYLYTLARNAANRYASAAHNRRDRKLSI